eukprot:UN14373
MHADSDETSTGTVSSDVGGARPHLLDNIKSAQPKIKFTGARKRILQYIWWIFWYT